MARFGIDEAGKGPVLGPMVVASVIEPARIDSPADTNASTVAAHAEAAGDAVRFTRRVARTPA